MSIPQKADKWIVFGLTFVLGVVDLLRSVVPGGFTAREFAAIPLICAVLLSACYVIWCAACRLIARLLLIIPTTGLDRSVSRTVEDNFYWPVPMRLRRGPSGELTENQDFQAAQGSIGRFAEAADRTVLAVSGRVIAGTWHYEVIAVSALGEIQRRISLDALGNQATPVFGLVATHGGYFYGLAQGGGEGVSLLYRFDSTGSLEIVYRFAEVGPYARIGSPVAVGPDGSLYVTFIDGGKNNRDGAIFRVGP